MQLGSSPTTGVPAATYGSSRDSDRRSTRRATPSCPVEIQVRPQHTGFDGSSTSNPAASSTATAACPICGASRFVNVSGHSTHPPPLPRPAGGTPVEPGRERRRGEPRDLPLRRHPAEPFQQPGGSRRRDPVDRARRESREPGPHRQPAHRPVRGRPRPRPPRVVVMRELRLVRRHVHVDRAVRQAALAGQAQVERVTYLGRAPAVGHHLAGSISHSRWARPRVECCSSRVTW